MATDLTNVAVSTGYVQLLHIDGGVGGSATRVYDGDGTGTPLEISTTEVVIKDGSFNLDVASHDGTNGLKLGGTLVTTSAAELNLLDGITAGTVSASKFLLVDSNKDLSGLRNLTATGTITAANFTGTGNTQIGDAAADTVAMNATITTNLIFEGSTDNAYETTLAITDPTADRTWTIPDATDTSVGRATTDTLTNKTLTSPDINTPDIDGGTVDAITSLTVANSVDIGNYTLTANGLTIDGTFTDGTLSIASGSITSAVNGTFSGTVQAEQLTTTDDATISDQLSVDGTMTISTGSIVDSTGTISFGDENLTTTGVGTFASLDISGNADIDGTMEADAYTVDGTALNEYIADTVGAMVGSNTETNITVTYEDSDNTLDFVIGTLNQDTTGTADNFTVSANNSNDETVYPIFVDGATGSQGAESDTGLTYNPSSGMLTISGELDAGSLDISGNADIDGTLEADAITVDGTTLAEYITDQAGGMFSSNTESGITVTFQDGDNTVDLSVDAAQTGITSLLATDIKIGEDDQTKIDFEDADKINFYAGNEKQLILEDGALYPGSDNIIDLGKSDNEFKDAFFDGTVTADAFAGPITGAVTGNADTATLATTVTVSDSTANTNFPVVFHNESNALLDDTGALRYNPSTGELLVPKLTVAGATTTVDTVTMNASNAIIFEGATADSNETTLSIVDPTADHTQYLINQGGYIPVLAAATTTAISATPEEINLIDGGTARGTTAVASGDGILINDGGTMRMTNVDTVSTYFASHNVGGSNIVTTGAINSGSITSGFGTIDTGSSNITTTGVGSFGSLDISGNVDVDGTLEADAITVDSTALNEYIADTVGAMVGSNTETGIAVTYEDGDNTLDFVLGTTQTTVTSMLNASLVAGRDADNQIKFSTDDQIIFRVAGGDGVTMKASGEIEATSLDISGAIDVDGTANLDVVDIDGAFTQDGGAVVFNEDSGDYDFRVESNGNTHMIFVDAGSDHVNIGTSTDFGGVLNVATADNNVQLVLASTDADSSEGPIMDFQRDSSSPAVNDYTGVIRFRGENNADEAINYAQIQTQMTGVTDGSEEGKLWISTMKAGSERQRISIAGGETIFNEDSQDIDFRVESDGNANMLVVDAGNNMVGIGVNPTNALLEVKTDDENVARFDGLQGNIDFRYGSDIEFDRAGQVYITANNGSGELNFRTGGQNTRMHIDSAGNVGIGTNDPKNLFHVSDGSTSNLSLSDGIIITHASNPKLVFEDTGEGTDDKVIMFNYYDEALRIMSAEDDQADWNKPAIAVFHRDGNVGVGTASPLTNFDLRNTTNTIALNTTAGAVFESAPADANNGTYLFGDGSADSDEPQILAVNSAAASTANIWSGIGFGLKYSGNTVATLAGIAGIKENSTDGSGGDVGALAFGTRATGDYIKERMRIKSNGDVQFGTSGGTGDIYHYGAGKFAINDSAGSASTPTYSFNSDVDTGMYRTGANEIGFATGGTERMRIKSTGVIARSQHTDTQGQLVINPDGSANDNWLLTLESLNYGFANIRIGAYGHSSYVNIDINLGGHMASGGTYYNADVLTNESSSDIIVTLTQNQTGYIVKISNNTSADQVYGAYQVVNGGYNGNATVTVENSST